MKCRAWEDLVQRQLDGESPQALQRHLLACPHCAAEGRTLARFFAGLSHLRPAAPPAGLSDRLTRSLLTEARGRLSSRRKTRALVVSGFAAAALLVAVSLWAWGPLAGKPRDNGGDPPMIGSEWWGREREGRAGAKKSTLFPAKEGGKPSLLTGPVHPFGSLAALSGPPRPVKSP